MKHLDWTDYLLQRIECKIIISHNKGLVLQLQVGQESSAKT